MIYTTILTMENDPYNPSYLFTYEKNWWAVGVIEVVGKGGNEKERAMLSPCTQAPNK